MNLRSLFLLIGLAFTLVPLSLAAQLGNGLTAYWDFDENLVDQSHDALGTSSTVADNLTFQGSAAGYTAAGKFGSAYSNPTGGAGHAQAADSADVDAIGGAISVSVWFRVNAFDKGWQALLVKGEGGNFRLHRVDASASIAWYDGNAEIGMGSPSVGDGNWHHMVSSQSGNQSKIYLDGALIGSSLTASTHANTNTPLMIGENPEAGGRDWNGDIDDIGIWNRALTAGEVGQLWNNGAGRPISSFLAPDDIDRDGLPAHWEVLNGLDDGDDGSINPLNGPLGDPDADGSPNLAEFSNGTNPQVADTDGDGSNDGHEATRGTDPNNQDSDGDELPDGVESDTGSFNSSVDTGTDPLNPDTDGDGFKDGAEVQLGSDPHNANSVPNGLILYYPFDAPDGATVANEAGPVNGTLRGGASYVPAPLGFGMAFQGNRNGANDGYVHTNLTANALGLGGTSYTAMAWVKWAGFQGGENHMVFGMEPYNAPQLHHGIRANGLPEVDNVHFGHWDGDVDDAGTVSPEIWAHLAFTFDGVTGRVFVNGVQTGSKAVGPAAAGTEDLLIGFTGGDGAGSFNGAIDEVKIFTFPLTSSQITKHMAPALPPVTNDDTTTMHYGGKVLLDIFENDSGGIDPTSLRIISGPSFGTVVPNDDGTILYHHTSGTPVFDTLTYRYSNFNDDQQDSAVVTVNFASSARLPSNHSKLPLEPPPAAFVLVDAFPGLTFDSPHDFSAVPGDPRKLFVTEGDGRVFLIPDVTANPTNADKILIVDLTSQTHHDNNEKAFKGITVHPDWANNGYLYVTYNTNTGSRLSRLTCKTAPPYTAKFLSERVLIDQSDTSDFHSIGTCEFGSDGYLYVSFGDEGTQSDGHNNSQYIDKDLWSSVLRIDVDKKPGSLIPNPDPDVPRVEGGTSGEAFYAIPPDNPFVGATSFNGVAVNPARVRTEIFILGLRNPWQFSLEDSDEDGTVDEVWVGDVGRSDREEVNVFTAGENGGWSWKEGTSSPAGIDGDHNGALEANATLTGPLWEYPHGGGAFQGGAVVAGYLYKEETIPELTGKFLAADFSAGNVWAIERTAGAPLVQRLAGEPAIVALKPNPSNGDILLLDRGNPGGNQGVGTIKRLVVGSNDLGFPQTLKDTAFFADLGDLTPQPGTVPYDPILRFWSDHAEKTRWVHIRNTTDRFTYSKDAPWTFPTGLTFAKHFDYPTEWETFARTINGETVTDRRPKAGSPRRRLETRFLVKTDAGTYGVSYQWRNISSGLQKDADLVGNNGASLFVDVNIDSVPTTLPWEIPSRSACLSCHTPEAGHALSFNTRQLNTEGSLAGASGNFLTLLKNAGYLEGNPGDPRILPRHVRPDEARYSLQARARSWLDVNCAYCHQAGGTGGGKWDASLHRTLTQTGLINGSPVDEPVQADDLLITPGHPDRSIIFNRLSAANGYSRMPPLATTVVDLEGAELLANWIASEIQSQLTYEEFRLAHFGNLTSPRGDPSANPDGDSGNNWFEWLTNTNPNSLEDQWSPLVRHHGNEVSIEFSGLRNKVTILRSDDLQNWSPWGVPGNEGIPLAPYTIHTLSGPAAGPQEFFRFEIEER